MEEDKMPLELSMIVSMLVGGVSSESDLNEPDVTAIAEQIMFSHRKRKRTCTSDEVCKIVNQPWKTNGNEYNFFKTSYSGSCLTS